MTSVLSRFGLRAIALPLPRGHPRRAARDRLLADVRGRLRPAWDALTTPETINAFKLADHHRDRGPGEHGLRNRLRARDRAQTLPGKGLLNAFIDLPLALSPVVVGLSLFLLYGEDGWFGGWLSGTASSSLRPALDGDRDHLRLAPVRCARGGADASRDRRRQEQAAFTLGASGWQTFWRITLPSIRWAVIYGVILTTARCLGEYGAVAVVSGRLQGQTETATLRVQERWEAFDLAGAYAISIVLALIAILVLVAMTVIRPKEEIS